MQAKELQKQDILKLGKALYNKAMQNVRAIIEQNKQLQKENSRLTEENDVLRKRIASMDENAITRLRDKKDAEIKELQERLGKAESEAVRSGNKAYSEHQRAENAENKVRELLGIPEIKEIWESILNHREFLASCHTIERGCYSDTPFPRLPFVQIVRLQKQVDILLTIPRHWCQPKRNTFRVTLVNRQCDSIFLQMALCLCHATQCLTLFARILCQFVIEGGALDG